MVVRWTSALCRQRKHFEKRFNYYLRHSIHHFALIEQWRDYANNYLFIGGGGQLQSSRILCLSRVGKSGSVDPRRSAKILTTFWPFVGSHLSWGPIISRAQQTQDLGFDSFFCVACRHFSWSSSMRDTVRKAHLLQYASKEYVVGGSSSSSDSDCAHWEQRVTMTRKTRLSTDQLVDWL